VEKIPFAKESRSDDMAHCIVDLRKSEKNIENCGMKAPIMYTFFLM
jgi:hypothetical protein